MKFSKKAAMEELSCNSSTAIIFYTAVSTVNKERNVIKGYL